MVLSQIKSSAILIFYIMKGLSIFILLMTGALGLIIITILASFYFLAM